LTQRQVYCTIVNLIVGGTYSWEKFGPQFYAKVMNLIRQSRDLYDEQLAKSVPCSASGQRLILRFDLLITPTCPFMPTKHVEAGSGPLAMIQPSVGQGNNTAIFDATGHPALTLPIGMLEPGDIIGEGTDMPVGMQLIGRRFDEATLYRVAYAWEQAFDWRQL
jgi:amidase